MGEWSRKIGERGEQIVEDFLEMIGWTSPQSGISIDCIHGAEHKRAAAAGPRTTHGIDYFFTYESPLISDTRENVVISSKYGASAYPNNPESKFKEYLIDLAYTLQCFRKSEFRQQIENGNQSSNIFNRGVLFWLNNDSTNNQDLISTLQTDIRFREDLDFDSIYLVDNARIAFIYDSLKFAQNTFTDSTIEFSYTYTGLNNKPEDPMSGAILPVQYINSGILPLRIANGTQTTLLLFIREQFDPEGLKRILGLAKKIGANYQGETIVCYPNYDPLIHENDVNAVLQSIGDTSFVQNLQIKTFNESFRN